MVRTTVMVRLGFGLVGLPLLLAACATPQQRVQNTELRLLASGFVAQPADTARRQAAMAALPSHRLVASAATDGRLFLFADPLLCGCVYFGTSQAFTRYAAWTGFRANALAPDRSDPPFAAAGWDPHGWDASSRTGFN